MLLLENLFACIFIAIFVSARSSFCCFSTNVGKAPNQDLPPDQYNQLPEASTPPSQSLVISGGGVNGETFSKGCGHSKYWNIESRILGGVNAMPNDFPWQVRLVIRSGSNQYLCGASILNTWWLITAAHCGVLTSNPSDITGYFADQDTSKTDDGEFTVTMSRIINHPNYNSKTVDKDFSLLKLSREIDFESWNVQPICLPKSCSEECVPGDTVFISGWGTTSEGGSGSKILQKAKMPLVSNSQCSSAYQYSSSPITDYQLCAGYEQGLVDSCQGDSGGPMTCPKYGYFMLMGVTSHGIGCGRSGIYGVYSRICKVLDWIGTTVGSSRSLYYFSLNNDTKTSLAASSNTTRAGEIAFYSSQPNSGNGTSIPVITGGEPVTDWEETTTEATTEAATTTTRPNRFYTRAKPTTTTTTTTTPWWRGRFTTTTPKSSIVTSTDSYPIPTIATVYYKPPYYLVTKPTTRSYSGNGWGRGGSNTAW